MNRNFRHSSNFRSARLVYVGETPDDKLSANDKKLLREAAEKAAKEKKAKDPKRKAAVEAGRRAAKRRASLRDVPDVLKALRMRKAPKKTGDNLTHEGTFGTPPIPVKITYPANPKEGAKPRIIIRYVNFKEKNDPAKFLKTLKEKNIDTGNSMVVTIQTPEGTTKINGKETATIKALVGDVEKFRKDLAKDNPKYKSFKVRAQDILHVASNPEAARKVKAQLKKYKKNEEKKDVRTDSISPEGDIPSSISELGEAIKKQEVAAKEAEEKKEEEKKEENTTGTSSTAGNSGGGGGGEFWRWRWSVKWWKWRWRRGVKQRRWRFH